MGILWKARFYADYFTGLDNAGLAQYSRIAPITVGRYA
jgi:hypothetical protein